MAFSYLDQRGQPQVHFHAIVIEVSGIGQLAGIPCGSGLGYRQDLVGILLEEVGSAEVDSIPQQSQFDTGFLRIDELRFQVRIGDGVIGSKTSHITIGETTAGRRVRLRISSL